MTDKKIERNLDEQGKRGIQLLYQAEQEASEIVEEAKQARIQLLKSAKRDAEKEATEYRAKLEKEYQAEVEKVSGTDTQYFSELDQKLDNLVKKMNTDVSQNEQQAVDILVEAALKFE
ncbi:putative V-type H+-transporting ATPase subunit G [Blattamonas nauphoetae]|uniref:V-type proton ATPase subunit G n=1 Tax=Blattamonas nauphoetae TaxID=2049346 RepID=A0ABQ9XHI0_9EUKA|nr:putative V-type H+-transporting ATPase subunit G [Blattamonas nauphoetae]